MGLAVAIVILSGCGTGNKRVPSTTQTAHPATAPQSRATSSASERAEFERNGRAIVKALEACRAKHRITILEDGSARCVKP